MSIIESTLKSERGFVAYLTAGDGGVARTKSALLALVEGGANILEVGMPFSDPLADGKTIQAAAQRSLEAGTTMDDVFQLIRDVKKETNTPIIFFSYYNPIYNAGDSFFRRAKAAGVDGCLVVDLPLEEADDYQKSCLSVDIDPIFILSPSTPVERIQAIAEKSRGMLYYVTRSGTTGIQSTLPDDLKENLQTIQSMTDLPVVAGFGISNAEMAAAVLAYADGFVVGSLFVDAVGKDEPPEKITQLARSIDPR
jgi:tryptophan synthase alpha chain